MCTDNHNFYASSTSQHFLRDSSEPAPFPHIKNEPSSLSAVATSAGARVIWGFMLENTYFTEFDLSNHRIIEDAYHLRKMRPTSHYITIRDSHLPAPARVYFGVAQVHLRMPGTRYYVKRRVVYIRPSAPVSAVAPSQRLSPQAFSTSTSVTDLIPSSFGHASNYAHPPHHRSRPAVVPNKKRMRSVSSTDSTDSASPPSSKTFKPSDSAVSIPVCSYVANQSVPQHQLASYLYQTPDAPSFSSPAFLLSCIPSSSPTTDWMPATTASIISSSSSSTTTSSSDSSTDSNNSSSFDSSLHTSPGYGLNGVGAAHPLWSDMMGNAAEYVLFQNSTPLTTCTSTTTGGTAETDLPISHIPEWCTYSNSLLLQQPADKTTSTMDSSSLGIPGWNHRNRDVLIPDTLSENSLQSILMGTLSCEANFRHA
ncbi:hypothetical protein BCR43DRAFT_510029 [Syncephalastrum racemosum]|uniref:Uncharacterized protein n=1 Tax=Syncephalastrum racemosum TaxID=13706 RepID=A0A1X2HTK6_SYNRA|nr:hypothetical protein BCR43DRAFT_510029 [Syncephalastrum racemosum]